MDGISGRGKMEFSLHGGGCVWLGALSVLFKHWCLDVEELDRVF